MSAENQPLPWEIARDSQEDPPSPVDPAETDPQTPGAPEFDLAAHLEQWRHTTLADVISAEHLKMIAEASGGFSFRPDPKLAIEALQTGRMRTGYTDLTSKVIYFNPLLKAGAPELGIQPWRPFEARGFAYHEAGHHTPEVEKLQEILLRNIGNISIIPESYRGDPNTETRFFNALHSHLHNALADIWLESYMGRRPYFGVREDIVEFQTAKGEIQDMRQLTKPEQLVQALLASRYREDQAIKEEIGRRPIDRRRLQGESLIKDNVDPDVFEAYCRLLESGAQRAMINREVYENYFATERDKERAMQRKEEAYREAFLPEYLRLMQAELDERKKKKQEQKKNEGAGDGQPQPGDGDKDEPSPRNDAVPLTKEEQQAIIEEILKALEAAGEELSSAAPSPEEIEQNRNQMNQIRQALQQRHQALQRGEQPPAPQPSEIEGPQGEELLRQLARELQRKERERQQKGLSESSGVRPESVRAWERLKKQYELEVTSTASVLSEIFLDDRRKRIEYLRRSGEVVPGLEYETISAMLSGDLDPDTKMDVVRNTEFLETELEGIVDRSGSMSGEKLERSMALFVILVEAFKKVREDLAAEDLISPIDDQPLRVGVTSFDTKATRITTLDEPLDDKKELTIIDQLSQTGGGTEETEALKQVIGEMKLRKSNVIKFILVLTDGQGNESGVAPIIRQVEEDDEVVFLVVGLGDDAASADAITRTYLNPLQNREKNVFAIAASNPNQILPEVLEFLKREVEKRRSSL